MRISLNKNQEQIDLIRAIGSKDANVSREALETLAAFITPVVNTILQQAATVGSIYRDMEYDEDDNPSIPLDLYYNVDVGYISTWSQTWAGGLPTNQTEGISEMKISTYRLDSAVSFLKKYARKCRLDVISKMIERLLQEVLLKQERNGWAVILKALADARTSTLKHVIKCSTESNFHINDMSRLITHLRRVHSAWTKGTPTQDTKGITDLYVSPEIKEQIRGFAFNPMNTKNPDGTAATTNIGIALPDAVREQMFRAAGTSEIWGITITDLLELGVGQKYNVLFKEFAGTDTDFGFSDAFDAATDEILVGFDLSRDSFIRPVAVQAESGGQFITMPDDQWVTRSDKAGLYGFLEEGRVCIDARGVIGMVC